MTRAWDTHARSQVGGVKLRTRGGEALGPSWDVVAFNTSLVATYGLSIDGRTWINRQTETSETLTTYYCYTNLGGCASAPSNQTPSLTSATAYELNPYYRLPADSDSIDFADGQTIVPDEEDVGIYAHFANTDSGYECYETYIATASMQFASALRVPRDTADPILYFGAYGVAAAEADLLTGGIGSCGTGWVPSDPPSGLSYRDGANALDTSYYIYSRADADSPWTLLVGPADRWTNAGTYNFWTVNQTRGEVWAKVAANQMEVWPIGTAYSAATPTVITIPGGNITGIAAWGQLTILISSNGNIYAYNGTTYSGAVPSPLNPATWTWSELSFGWLVVTDPDAVHFFRVSAGEVEFFQSLEGSWSSVGCVGPDHAVSGMWRRLMFDHAVGAWRYAGDMPHIQSRYDDGWAWNSNIAGNVIAFKEIDSRYYYRYLRVF